MSSEWKTTTIGEQITLQRGIDITKAQQRPGVVPVVSSGGISSYHDTAYAKAPGVILGRKGTLGTVFYLKDDYWPHDTSLWVRDFHGNHPQFVYYFFKSMASDLAALDVGSANPALNRNHVHPIIIQWPELPEQLSIARILGALDDKIELNRNMNHTLESMAQALFKSWFVDFDPVVAKSEGRQPTGMNAEIASLFPSEFQNSELGTIPKGWHVDTLGNVLSIIKGRSYTSNELQDSDTALVSLKSFKRSGGYRTDGLKAFVGKYRPEQVLEVGELAVSCTDITQEADVVGRPIVIPHQSRFKTLVASLDLLILRSTNPDITVPFLYNLLRTEDYVNHIIGHASGTTVLHLSKDGVPSYKFVVPPPSILLAFNKFAKPVYEKLSTIDIESDNLASIRDSLLPKLLSGEIRVKVT